MPLQSRKSSGIKAARGTHKPKQAREEGSPKRHHVVRGTGEETLSLRGYT